MLHGMNGTLLAVLSVTDTDLLAQFVTLVARQIQKLDPDAPWRELVGEQVRVLRAAAGLPLIALVCRHDVRPCPFPPPESDRAVLRYLAVITTRFADRADRGGALRLILSAQARTFQAASASAPSSTPAAPASTREAEPRPLRLVG